MSSCLSYIRITTFIQVCRKMRLKGGLECKLILIFCVGIVHTNLYNYFSWVSDIMQYLELFDTAFHACG